MIKEKISVKISGEPIESYRIVIAKEASDAIIYAAEELTTYIYRTIGIKLATVSDSEQATEHEILVGKTNRYDALTQLGNDDFEIAAYPGHLSLCGGGDRGTLYAVYTYLEKYIGWRWFAKDAEVLRKPVSRDICAGENITERPLFNFRDCMYYDTKIPELRVKLKLNAEDIPQSMGGDVGYNGFCHTLSSLCPPEQYFAEHPEYYALHNGERTTNQLCLSNPDVLRIVTENALERLRKNKREFISISQNDNTDYCTCDKCRAIDEEEGSPSGIMLRFVNSVAAEIEKEFPDVLVDTLAYQYTRHYPSKTKPRHNVAVRLCSIECDFRHAYYDTLCADNNEFCKDIEEWSTICNNLYIWDYVVIFTDFSMFLPNFAVLRDNMRFFAEHNVKGVLSLGAHTGQGADFDELKTYLLCKLLWNPYMSATEYEYHMNDFLEGYYGNAWKYIKEYISLLTECTSDQTVGCFTVPLKYCSGFAKRLGEAYELLDKAESAAETADEKKRVRVAAMTARLVDICYRQDALDKNDEEAVQQLREIKRKYYSDSIELGIRRSEWKDYPPLEEIDLDEDVL